MFRSDPEVQGMAKAMWVALYASEVEEAGLEEELGPGAGGDWFDVAPEHPPEAEDIALILVGRFETGNNMPFVSLEHRAFDKDGMNLEEASDQLREEFGHYMAMRSMGHGVAWEDDHAKSGIKYPHFEPDELRDMAMESVQAERVEEEE